MPDLFSSDCFRVEPKLKRLIISTQIPTPSIEESMLSVNTLESHLDSDMNSGVISAAFCHMATISSF